MLSVPIRCSFPNNDASTRHYPVDGIIDEVGIFNVALTVDEINSLMNNGLAGIAAVSP